MNCNGCKTHNGMAEPLSPSLQEIASCVSGYDPNALPVAQAQEFITRLVPKVRSFLCRGRMG